MRGRGRALSRWIASLMVASTSSQAQPVLLPTGFAIRIEPLYATISLANGLPDGPIEISVPIGGPNDNEYSLEGGCVGSVTSHPSIKIVGIPANGVLTIVAEPDPGGDPSLIVVWQGYEGTPDCSSSPGVGVVEELGWAEGSLPSTMYVWVADQSADGTGGDVTLRISLM